MASDEMRRFINLIESIQNRESTILEGIFDIFRSKEEKEIRAGEEEREEYVKEFQREWNIWLGKTQRDKSMRNFVDFLMIKGGLARDDVDEILGNDKFSVDDLEDNPEYAVAQLEDSEIKEYIDDVASYIIRNYNKITKRKTDKNYSFNGKKYRQYLKTMGLENIAGRVIAKVKRGDYDKISDSEARVLAGIAYAIIKSSDL